jgi:hypothetical protein
VPGDLRFGGRIRLVAGPRVATFVRGEVSLPTGDDRDLAGEPSWTLAWNLIGRFTLPAGIAAAVTGGVRFRGAEVLIADRLVGDELFGALGVSVPIPPVRPLWCDAEQVRLSGEVVAILGNDVASQRGPSPAEARIGLVTRPRGGVVIGIRIGTGLGDELGAPRFRGLVELAYQPAAPTTSSRR